MPKGLINLTSNIHDDDDEMTRILREIEDEENNAVDIGILSDEDELLRIYASANEFGTRDGHVPERSFIRKGVDLNGGAIEAKADEVWGQIIDGKMSLQQGLGIMGEFIQAIITRRITTLRTPKNADATKKRKKSTNPLIDTGRMRASIRWTLARNSDGESGI